MKATVYETFLVRDIDALLDCRMIVALQFDGSHARKVKAVHLELALQATDAQIRDLETAHNTTYIKLKTHLQHGGGVYKFQVPHFEQRITDQSPKSFQIRRNRAVVRHGGVGGMVNDIL